MPGFVLTHVSSLFTLQRVQIGVDNRVFGEQKCLRGVVPLVCEIRERVDESFEGNPVFELLDSMLQSVALHEFFLVSPALTPEQEKALAMTPADDLLGLQMLQPDQVNDPLLAYQISKRANSLRVMAEAVRWGKRGARINTISPGIIITPLARDELSGPRGAGYRRMIELSAAGRAGTPDEVGTVAALLMGPEGTFITGSDFLMDGGVTAAYRFGELAPT